MTHLSSLTSDNRAVANWIHHLPIQKWVFHESSLTSDNVPTERDTFTRGIRIVDFSFGLDLVSDANSVY